jgi:hypothetical protein
MSTRKLSTKPHKRRQGIVYILSSYIIDSHTPFPSHRYELLPDYKVNIQCSAKHGATFLHSHQLEKKDVDDSALGAMKEQFRSNARRWVNYAREKFEIDIQIEDIIVVTGTDKTPDWANVVFCQGNASGVVTFTVGGNERTQSRNRLWGEWSQTSLNRNTVLQRGPEIPSQDETFRVPQYNQCVFLRGLHMKRGNILSRIRSTITTVEQDLNGIIPVPKT